MLNPAEVKRLNDLAFDEKEVCLAISGKNVSTQHAKPTPYFFPLKHSWGPVSTTSSKYLKVMP